MSSLTMKAVVTAENKQVSVQNVPIPKPGTGQILVKVVAAAQNPTDWKHVHYVSGPGLIVGSDFAGVVEEIGPEVPVGLRKKGERVAGFIHGAFSKEIGGAFAEYLIVDAGLVISLPEHLSFEDASTVSLCALTASQMMYDALNLPVYSKSLKDPSPILVWGAASAVGLFVVQLAALAKLRVIATASAANHDLLKSLGAEAVFDYKDPSVVDKIRAYAGDALEQAADCISQKDTAKLVGDCLSSEKGGRVSVIIPVNGGEENGMRKDVEYVFTLAYEIIGQPMNNSPDPDSIAKGKNWCTAISKLLHEKTLKTAPTKIFSQGLASVEEGFKYMMDGKVHGEKIVYRIADTP